MDSEKVLELLPGLKTSVVRLIIHRILTDFAQKTDREIMRETGVTDRATYYAAKDQVKRLIGWEKPDQVVGKNPTTGREIPDQVGKYPTRLGKTLPPPSREIPDHPPRIISAALDAAVITSEELDLRGEAMQLDLLPGDGLPNTPNSNYSKKRREQVAFLQRAWGHYFTKATPLLPVNAKRMLSLTDDVSEDVLDRFEEVSAKGIESPLAYLMKVLESTKNKPVQMGVKPVAIGKPEQDEGVSYMMNKPSEKTLRIEARARAMGRLKTEDDDE